MSPSGKKDPQDKQELLTTLRKFAPSVCYLVFFGDRGAHIVATNQEIFNWELKLSYLGLCWIWLTSVCCGSSNLFLPVPPIRCNCSLVVGVFLSPGQFVWILIGSWWYFPFALIAITLVLPHSIEMRLIISNDSFHTKSFFAYEAFEVLENEESVKLS